MAEINTLPVNTGVTDVLSPVFTLWYLQKNITTDIAPYVTRVTYTDNIKSESDTIEVSWRIRTVAGWINGIREKVTRSR